MKKFIMFLLLAISSFTFSYEKVVDREMGLIFERDVPIEVRDGVTLYANVFRPIEEGNYPVIASMGPYGKDKLSIKYGSDEGDITVSKYAGFEVVDPAMWVPEGYVVVNVDSRGTWKSGGDITVFSKKEATDYYDIIEWAGVQPWSNGNVGTSGVSYYAISQWNMASLNPPHLKAIIPWEGFTDIYRDGIYHGGIEEKGFIVGWYKKVLKGKRKGSNPEDFIGGLKSNVLYNDFYKDRDAELTQIKVPAYIVSSWSDHGLHSRGTIEGYKGIASEDKWLYIHGIKKWEYFYSKEGVAEQKRFFDYYLKGVENDMQSVPKVRYAVREKYYVEDYESADTYPLAGIEKKKLYLSNNNNSLEESIVNEESVKRAGRKTTYKYTFEEDTKIVGGMTLKTYVSTTKGDDIDLFVGVEKLDEKGKKVNFQGNDTSKGHVASGWLRVSQRTLAPEMEDADRIFLSHDRIEKISPNDVVEVSVEIQPSGTLFKKGESIALVISNKDLKGAGDVKHVNINKGKVMIHNVDGMESYLEIPVLKN